ncbi:AMP phosphorylase [Candidatus Woesearchaeota archaeon]|nr:AMP phosphorylase [Candidatus Woesearchaeota archaeon]
MKLAIKDMDITTGGTLIVILNKKDADVMDLHPLDRILIRRNSHKTVAVLDVTTNARTTPPGCVGCFEEVLTKLGAKHNDAVEVTYAKKPESIEFIRQKLDGEDLSGEKIDVIVDDVVRDELTESEVSYFVAACYVHGNSDKETVAMTKSIVDHGDRVDLGKRVVLDKHCTGGVAGNRTSLSLVPIILAAGLCMPKTSSRSITSPAGTADAMEVLAPVTFPAKRMESIAREVGGFLCWGGGANLASADDKLIKVRNALSLDPEGMLLSSILAKKAAVGASHVLIDIPIGPHTKIKTRSEAKHLQRHFESIGHKLGMRCHVMLTDGSQPIGRGIGPALEARDALYILTRDPRRPMDLERKVLLMASMLLKIAGKKDPDRLACALLDSGKAYAKMKEIIAAQGGNPLIHPDKIPVGQFEYTVTAQQHGKIMLVHNRIISHIARIAGAPVDKGAGVCLHHHVGDKVKKGQALFTIHAESREKLGFAREIANKTSPVLVNF